MAVSKRHKGWRWDRENDQLDFYYEGTLVGHIDSGGMDLESGKTFKIDGSGISSSTLDAVYDGGAVITVDNTGGDVEFDLNDASNDNNVQIKNVTSGTIAIGLLVDTETASAGCIITDAIKVTTSGASSTIVDALDASDAGITNAINIGGNAIAGTNFNVSGAGAVVGVGVNYGSGTLVGTGDIAINTNKFTVTASSGNTVVAGTLTVDGTSTLTGNVTASGDLTVVGSLTFGGTLSISDTLTVDELILDTDGSDPGSGNAYVFSDNTGDLTLNALNNKQINFAINGTDQVTLSATVMDMTDVALNNVGYLILNAATAPGGGEVYLVNDVSGELTLNALSGKKVNIAIAGTDEVVLGDTDYIFNDAGSDRNTRFETVNLAFALYLDGGKDCVVIGDNTDISDIDYRLMVGNVAKTLGANQSASLFYVKPTAATTESGGGAETHAYISTAYFAEPNITHTGTSTITVAATVYIADAPTEGATNYALYVGSGGVYFPGVLQVVGIATFDDDIKMATTKSITDAGGDELLTFVESATPVNEFTITSSDTAGEPKFATTGGDADITMNLHANGNAGFNFTSGTIGDAARPDIHLQSDVDTGLYGGTNFLMITTGGTVRTQWGVTGQKVGGTADHGSTAGTNCISIFNGTAPVGPLTNGGSIYSAAGELTAIDSGGATALLTP